MKVWITKYALTDGIQECEGEAVDSFPNVVAVKGGYCTAHYHGKDWHKTYEAAVIRAGEMRVSKIAALKKKIAKLETLSFL